MLYFFITLTANNIRKLITSPITVFINGSGINVPQAMQMINVITPQTNGERPSVSAAFVIIVTAATRTNIPTTLSSSFISYHLVFEYHKCLK
jgi:uncharacterized membrane protein